MTQEAHKLSSSAPASSDEADSPVNSVNKNSNASKSHQAQPLSKKDQHHQAVKETTSNITHLMHEKQPTPENNGSLSGSFFKNPFYAKFSSHHRNPQALSEDLYTKSKQSLEKLKTTLETLQAAQQDMAQSLGKTYSHQVNHYQDTCQKYLQAAQNLSSLGFDGLKALASTKNPKDFITAQTDLMQKMSCASFNQVNDLWKSSLDANRQARQQALSSFQKAIQTFKK